MIVILLFFKLSYVKLNLHRYRAYLYLAPAMILAGLFCWYPAIKAFIESFFTVSHSGTIQGFAAFSNYRTLFSDKAFINSVRITLKFIVEIEEGNIFTVPRILNHDLLLGFRKLGVECPFPQLDVHSC